MQLDWHLYCSEIHNVQFEFVEPMLRHFLLRTYCHDHCCALCKVQCVGVDGVVGVATHVCLSTDVPPLEFPATRIQVQFGCRRPPHSIFRYCAEHLSRVGAQPIVCDERTWTSTSGPYIFCRTCKGCNKQIPCGNRFHACSSGCDFV